MGPIASATLAPDEATAADGVPALVASLAASEAAGTPRPRRLDRLRARGRLVLLLADIDGGDRGRCASATRRTAWSATAWFDHQWGDFISVGGGGWDWFAVNLEDGTDLTLSLVRDADGSIRWSTGRSCPPDGRPSSRPRGVHGR